MIVARLGVPRGEIGGPAGPGGALGTPPHEVAAGHGALGILRTSSGLRTLMLVDVWLGVAIGAVDVAAPALADPGGRAGAGRDPAGGVRGRERGRVAVGRAGGFVGPAPVRRWVRAADGGARGLCARVRPWLALAAVLVFAGAAYGVLNVALFELLDVVVPPRNAVEALTWLTTAGGIGIAAGATVAGQLAADSPESALLLTAVATIPGAILAFARRRSLA